MVMLLNRFHASMFEFIVSLDICAGLTGDEGFWKRKETG